MTRDPQETSQPENPKWEANRNKAAFLASFPGLRDRWEGVQGLTVDQVRPMIGKPGAAVLVFSDATFLAAGPVFTEPRDIKTAVTGAREALEPSHPHAYEEYDRLAALDQAAGREARMHNILGAIRQNLDDIPELKQQIRSLVKTWDT